MSIPIESVMKLISGRAPSRARTLSPAGSATKGRGATMEGRFHRVRAASLTARFARVGTALGKALRDGVHLRGLRGDFLAELDREIAHGAEIVRECVHACHAIGETRLLIGWHSVIGC